MPWKIPLSDIDFGPEEEAAALRVIRSRWLSMGAETEAFEQEFAEYLGIKHAVAVANGTAALHLVMIALGIGPGDVVIQPAVNFVAAANMTIAVGAIPVFADICSLSEPTISPVSIKNILHAFSSKRYTSSPFQNGKRPKSVLVMHYGGYPCRMDEIKEICNQNNLVLIEDACHGVGGRCVFKGISQFLGTVGDVGCFSFFSNKNLVTGEGGMITTNRDDIAEKVRLLRSHGMTSVTWDRHRGQAATYDVIAHGYNFRIDEIRSAIGREQLKKLDRNNELRRKLTSLYWQKLEPLKEHGWTIPFKNAYTASSITKENRGPLIERPHARQVESKEYSKKAPYSMRALWNSVEAGPASGGIPLGHHELHENACHLFPVVAPDPDIRLHCAGSMKIAGIQTSLHYPFIPSFSAFETSQANDSLMKSREFCSSVITLPLYPTFNEEQVEFVTKFLLAAAECKDTSIDNKT